MSNFFNKKLPKSCEYCVYSKALEFTKETVCKKRGVTSQRDFCRSFKYDPLKRTPQKKKIGDNYTPEDFKL